MHAAGHTARSAVRDPRAFEIHVPDSTLGDLRARLMHTRWIESLGYDGWRYGFDVAYLRELVRYWRERFDWRVHEAAMNRFGNFRATVGGAAIHFIHERGRGPDPLPIVLTHGFPDSVLRFAKIIPMLTDPAAHGGDPADAFDVVAPCLPGYGFSDPTHERKVNVVRIGEWFGMLMKDVLGYSRYGAQGGDWGALVTSRLGFAF